ncbi:hypothetical protein SNEBB_009321 [Seison nebaliae]|nr:hypothetical protein SNEBB_009321 [Seison nebaliae]
MALNLSILKEPRCFIKLIEILLAIIAFSTISDGGFAFIYSGVPNGQIVEERRQYSPEFSYPFDFMKANASHFLHKDKTFACTAEFFVLVGVIAFLTAIGNMVVYLVFEKCYREKHIWSLLDTFFSFLIAILWLAGSCAWARAVVLIKSYFKLESVQLGNPQIVHSPTFTNITTSVVVGFINFAVWLGNIWLLYKHNPIIADLLGRNKTNQQSSSTNNNNNNENNEPNQNGIVNSPPYTNIPPSALS